jgi:endonuclease/exonuclease/phosphatase family metal-dependent hydrolase
MRLATFNVENMFERPAAMNLPTLKDGEPFLEDYYRLLKLIGKQQYSNADKEQMLDIMKRNKGLLTVDKSDYIRLRVIRGKFLKKSRGGPVEIIANGRGDWIGWFELVPDIIKETAIENTGRVIRDVNADVFCFVEVEDRIALNHFNSTVIPKVHGKEYDHVMLIDGNDDRGIDVGIMTRKQFDIETIASHVDDMDANGVIFSRDCPEYKINTPSGNTLLVLINHFKSKGHGSQTENNNKRERQAKKVRDIYETNLNQGLEYIAVAGDLNDTPESDPLRPLLGNGSTLTDIMKHNKFKDDGHPGTYANGSKSQKIDYILMSPQLSNKVKEGGIERHGVWGGKHGTLFPHYQEIKEEKDAASDHASLWVDFNL